MSFLYALIFLLILGGACFGSWKAALRWSNRTRDARHEDPRDQEIRELSAVLSIARKNLEKLDNRSGSSAHELAVLQDQVHVTAAALAESQEKIAAANEAVNREIETREALDARLAQMRRDLDAAKSRVAELEVQVKIVSPSSGLVAGLDDVLEDDEKEVFTIRHEHKVFKQQVAELEQAVTVEKAESARWKQHCNVMGKTNKVLRQRTDELGEQLKDLDDLKAKALQLITATADNETLRREADELRTAAAEIPPLKSRITELEGVQNQNLLLQDQVAKLSNVHETNAQLTQQLADFTATRAQLLQAQQDMQRLQTELAELLTVQQDNVNLRARIEALASIETDNEALRGEIRQLQTRHAGELGNLRHENEKLLVRVAAIDQIQEENAQLLLQSRELRHTQTKVSELQTQLADMERVKAESLALQTQLTDLERIKAESAALEAQLTELRPLAAELESTRAANRQQATELEVFANVDRINADLQKELACLRQSEYEQRNANEELGKRIESLMLDLRNADKLKDQIADWTAERAAMTAQLLQTEETAAQLQSALAEANRLQAAETAQLRHGIEIQQATAAELRETLARLETDRNSISQQLLETQNLHAAMSAQAAELRIAHDALQAKLLQTEKAASAVAESSARAAEQENDNTDSLPVLREPEKQDDLKSIRGVGAKLEQKLNMIGICNFRDLIELEESDYERAAQLIPDLANRIQRDNWMQQARDLHRHKYDETI